MVKSKLLLGLLAQFDRAESGLICEIVFAIIESTY